MPRFDGESYVMTQPIYDTVELAVAAGQVVQFFQVPLGGLLAAAFPKTYAHTNLVQAGTLERGVDFEITGFSMFTREWNSAAARHVSVDDESLYMGHVNLELGQVSYARLPAAMIPSGGAERVMTSNIAPAVTEYYNNRGVSAVSNRFHLSNPVRIAEQESIRVTLDLATAITVLMDVTFVLWGNMTRPVR